MIVSTILITLLTATFATLTVAWLKRMPTLQLCPTCTHRTQAVLLPRVLRPLERWVNRRWCPDCEWEGIGRKGPEFIPGRQLAHDSGFHWGADGVGPNGGFRWRVREPLPPLPTPPDHRSGFRFAAAPAPPEAAANAHRSGFAWAGPDVRDAPVEHAPEQEALARGVSGQEPPAREASVEPDPEEAAPDDQPQRDHPSGFSWGRRPAKPAGFQWKHDDPPRPDPGREPGGFQWGGSV